jgi:hypothetical protein
MKELSIAFKNSEEAQIEESPVDHNVYTPGSIGGHNVIIAGLYTPGNNPAVTVVTQMRNTFPGL